MKNITEAMALCQKTIDDEKQLLAQLRKIASKNLRIRRLAKRITMRGAAKLLGISATHYFDLEHGYRNLSVELAVKADEAFGV
jgi:hypothetical protein